jgi:dCMP deaminase
MISWDEYFMSLVYVTAIRSKDASTKNAAIIVGPHNEIRSTGYNSFPRGIIDDISLRQERPLKYKFIEHGERNAIYNAARIGVSTENCIMYTLGTPCSDCARGIIQSGIKEVIIHLDWEKINPDMWKDEAEITKILFLESGVKLTYYGGSIQNEIYGWNRNEKIKL